MSVDIKRVETVAMVEKIIDKLILFKNQIGEGTTTVEDISIQDRLIRGSDEVAGSFNMSIDIDYIVESEKNM